MSLNASSKTSVIKRLLYSAAVVLILLSGITFSGCSTEYDDKDIIKIVYESSPGMSMYPELDVKTFDFESNSVTRECRMEEENYNQLIEEYATMENSATLIANAEEHYNNVELITEFSSLEGKNFIIDIKKAGIYSWEDRYETDDIIMDGSGFTVTVYFNDNTSKSTYFYYEYPANLLEIEGAFVKNLGTSMYYNGGGQWSEMSDYSRSAMEILRNPAETMKWYVVPLLLIVLMFYAKEIKAKNWSVVLGGLALWGMDLFNEIWNSIVFHASGFAPVWGTPNGVGNTALLLLIGYNIEISFMFALMGIFACTLLPEDKKKKIFGINNRVLFAVINSIGAVIVECYLNYCDLLTWEYSWWSRSFPWLVFLIGYLPFFVTAYIVHDLPTIKKKVIAVGSILGFDLLLLIIFGAIGWM